MHAYRHMYLRRRTVLACVLAMLLLPASVSAADGDPWHVEKGKHVPGDVATVSQPIVVDGQVDGDVTSWSGDITITGQVSGDVVSYTGHVVISDQATVGGSVMSLGGGVDRNANAHVERAELEGGPYGNAVGGALNMMMPSGTTQVSSAESIGRGILGVMTGLFVFAFALLWGALWPNRTLAASVTLRRLPVRSVVVGALSTLLLVLVVPPLVGVLTASMVGLPVIVVLLVLLNAPYVYGLAAFARALALSPGRPLVPTPIPPQTAIIVVAAVALAVAAISLFAPIAGMVVFYLLASPGLGAVILSRGGLVAPRLSV